MKQIIVITMLTLAIMLTGCQSVLKATAEKTSPDGTVVKTALTLRSSGDKMSELAAEGAFAEALTDHPAAGVNKAGTKQESSGTDAILAGVLTPLVNGLVSAYTFRPPVATTPTQPSGVTGLDGDYSFTGATSGLEAGGGDDWSIFYNAPVMGMPSPVSSRFTAKPGVGGIGVYGSSDCSRCRAYIDKYDIDLINYWDYRDVALSALKARAFSGGAVKFPLKITEDSYQMMAE